MMLSESQERMLMVLKPGMETEAEAIFVKWGLDFADHRPDHRHPPVRGQAPGRGHGRPADQGDGRRGAALRSAARADTHEARSGPRERRGADVSNADALLKLVGSPDQCSRRWVWEQYDHLILGNTVQMPGGDAAIVRVENGPKGLALTTDVDAALLRGRSVRGRQAGGRRGLAQHHGGGRPAARDHRQPQFRQSRAARK